ncbi:MAG: hypothetical protein MUE69_13435 [Myxococcota bacterium]|jgi:hypothetical protein|nr:hypothetical protein [Myxococcota bacterium]
MNAPTRVIAEELERKLSSRASSVSLDTLRQMRDAAWFGTALQGALFFDPSRSLPGRTLRDPTYAEPVVGGYERSLLSVLSATAAEFVDLRGTHFVVRDDEDVALRVRRWRWLSLHVPTDLLAAAAAESRGLVPMDATVELGGTHIARILEKGVAETHLHLGSAVDFPTLWSFLIASLGGSTPRAEDLPGPDHPFGGASRFLAHVIVAAGVRLWIARFLRANELGLAAGVRFDDWLKANHGERGGESTLPMPRADRRALPWMQSFARGKVTHGLSEDLVAWYRSLALPRGVRLRQESRGPKDPLGRWLVDDTSPHALIECRFLHRVLHYLHGAGKADASLARYFWQYLRVRNQTFRYLTQEPGTAGLDWFSRYFRRISALRGSLNTVLFQRALEHASRGVNLVSFEGRTAPASSWAANLEHVRRVAYDALMHQRATSKRPEVALVLHLVKAPNDRVAGKKRFYGDTRGSLLARYGRWYEQRRLEVDGLKAMLVYHPETLLILRGLDVASRELALPLWPTQLLLQDARRASGDASRALLRQRGWRIPPLRMTYHVGEDYRRLVEGLRRCHELLEFGLLERGDRVGHGIALVDDPERWAIRAPATFQPAEERLDDLLWEIDRYELGDLADSDGREPLIRREIRQLVEMIYGVPYDPHAMTTARRMRHDASWLRGKLGYPNTPPRLTELTDVRAASADELVEHVLRAYLTDPGVFSRGYAPIEVRSTPGEVSFLGRAQAFVRRQFAQREITIETNPSSNLCVGDLGRMTQHATVTTSTAPLERAERLMMSINTDDPLTFATGLADEYGHSYYALLRSGVSAHEALGIIDALRDQGVRSRFSLPESADPAMLVELLDARRRKAYERISTD